MIFNSLSLENFRVFQGRHHIDLTSNSKCPIVLFGGLNGAGKTSILTAIRVALFGKMSLEGGVTNKDYHHFLTDQINRGDSNCSSASVAIQFEYSKLGNQYSYLIERSWVVKDQKVNERLSIQQNGEELSELTMAQAQGFIFDLIPLGVADLFFFDGEKIKAMADDEDGHVLIEALKKLVGVDLIERAAFDTGVVLRKNRKLSSSLADRKIIEQLESELQKIEGEIDNQISEYGNSHLPYRAELTAKLKKAKQKLDESGGTWAMSRDSLIAEQGGLSARKKELEAKIVDLMRGDLVFSLAPSFMGKLQGQLSEDLSITKATEFNDQLDKKMLDLKQNDPQLVSLVKKLKNNNLSQARHKISSYQFQGFENTINNSKKALKEVKDVLVDYEELEKKIDNLGLNISRAPDQAQLKEIFGVISDIELEIERTNNKGVLMKRHIRDLLNKAIQITYSLDKSYSKLQHEKNSLKIESVGDKVISAMSSLSSSLIQSKISELEAEFNRVFQRLIRKKDMVYQARINRENFKIELIDKSGHSIDKKMISSGEKQIYALSMLEALGKTSGRSLPFIIDTPLGRLDSNHRSKLVKNFFPVIGDQVIVLSTDTEVDEQFYEDLMPFINKSYEIKYNEEISSSTVEMGYFWTSDNKEIKVELLA